MSEIDFTEMKGYMGPADLLRKNYNVDTEEDLARSVEHNQLIHLQDEFATTARKINKKIDSAYQAGYGSERGGKLLTEALRGIGERIDALNKYHADGQIDYETRVASIREWNQLRREIYFVLEFTEHSKTLIELSREKNSAIIHDNHEAVRVLEDMINEALEGNKTID